MLAPLLSVLSSIRAPLQASTFGIHSTLVMHASETTKLLNSLVSVSSFSKPMIRYFLLLLCIALGFCSCAAESHLAGTITVTNSTGDLISSFRTQKYQEKQSIFLHFNKTGVKWSIQPKVKGVDLRPNGQVVISTGELISKTTFLFTAVTAKENATLPFDIEVYGCEYGSFTSLKDGVVPIDFFFGYQLVYSGMSHGVYICIPHGEYQYRSQESTATRISVFDEDGTHFHTALFNGYGEPIEGSFSNDFSAPLAISFPPTVSLLRGIEKRMQLPSRGPITNVTIHPPLPFNFNQFELTVMSRTEGVTTYTITASYGDRQVQSTFTVYCGSCPEGTTRIKTLMDMKSLSYSLPSVETPDLYTFSQSFCVPHESFAVRVYAKAEGSLFFYKDEHIFYEYRGAASNTTHTLTVRFFEHLAFASPLAFFVGSPQPRWSELRFKDASWRRGSEGGWGSFDASSTAFFRASFRVEDLFAFSFFLLHLRGEGEASVFINGSPFNRASLHNTSIPIVIPSSFMKQGDNVIAVSLTGVNSISTTHSIPPTQDGATTIHFAMALDATNSAAIPILEGDASAVQASTDPKHPPEKAFALTSCTSSAWTSTFPSELIFDFNRTQQVVNRLQMRLPHGRYTLEVVGVSDASQVPLGRFNGDSTALLQQGVSFASTRAFQSIHFLFNSTQPGDALSVSCVRLYSHTSFPCPSRLGYKRSLEGAVVVKKCPLGSTGRKRAACVRDSDGVRWAEDRSQCYSTNPQKGMVFIDWTFTLFNMTEEDWSGRKSELSSLLAESMYLKADAVQYLYEDFSVNGEMTVMKGFSRCCVKSVYGEALEYDFKEMMKQFNEVVGKMGAYSGSIDQVVLRRYVNWVLVISISVLSLCAVLLLTVYYASRVKKGNMKKLIRRGIGEQPLLPLCVCCMIIVALILESMGPSTSD